MLCDYHVHLERGPYTLEWLQQFLQQAKKVGVAELGVVEHLYRFREARQLFLNPWVEERQTQYIGDYLDLMQKAKKQRWPVRVGLEVDYVPGKEEELRAFLRKLPLDFVIGAVHWLGDWGFDTDPATWEGKDVLAVYEDYYDALSRAARSDLFDIIGHPGNIGYFGHLPDVKELGRLEDGFVASLRNKRVVVEINTGGLLRPAHALWPRLAMLRKLRTAQRDIVLGSDAHLPEHVGHAFPEVLRLLKQSGFICTTRFLKRKTAFPAL
jgi:histidinol-phosphatase (PHP family)